MPIGPAPYPRTVLPDDHWQALYEACVVAVDETISDLERFIDGTPFSELMVEMYLPPKYLLRYSHAFLRQFLVCLISVSLKMRLPGFHPLGCTAEEIALRALRIKAEVLLDMQGKVIDFGTWEDVAFEDLDHELLYDDRMDGIEDFEAGRELGTGYLRFDEWFKPFNRPRIVHPFISDGIEEPWQVDHHHYSTDDEESEDDDDYD